MPAPTFNPKARPLKFGCIPEQSNHLIMSPQRRWFIYIIGVLETFVFGGCIFGWAQLVYILKNEGIYSDLCLNQDGANNTFHNSSHAHKYEDSKYFECEEQDQKFALIYTITCLVYASPAVLIGLLIHHWGLAVSRVTAALMLILGFTGLGVTTKENTGWLNVSMILIALGGNQLRLTGFQFCNLFPRYRSTALTIISGSYATSAGLFMIFQFGQGIGISLWAMCISLASLAALSMLASSLMPWHHIPYENSNKVSNTNRDWRKDDIPVLKSFFSFSSFTHTLWMVIIMAGIIYFNTSFNSWVTRISSTNEEAGHLTLLYSLSAFACPFVTPLPGLLTDYISRRGPKDVNFENGIHQKLKSPILALILVPSLSILLQSCLCFEHPAAVYVSLLALICLRPSVVAVGCDFLRIRFPPYHFYRILGMYGTLISILSVIQYPIFIWSQNDYLTATIFFIFLIGLTLLHPLHLLSKNYRIKIISEEMREPEKDSNLLIT